MLVPDRARSVAPLLRDGGEGSDGDDRVTSGFSGSGCWGGGAGGSENLFFASDLIEIEPPFI